MRNTNRSVGFPSDTLTNFGQGLLKTAHKAAEMLKTGMANAYRLLEGKRMLRNLFVYFMVLTSLASASLSQAASERGTSRAQENEGASSRHKKNRIKKREGGIDGSGGGELRAEAGSAWFPQKEKAIKYCFITDKDFGIETSKVRNFFEQAFAQWTSYSKEKNVDNFASKLVFLNSCDDSQDLTIYLGKETELISEEKTHYNYPIALSVRTEYSLDEKWGKGLIWLAKPYSIDPAIKLPDYFNDKRLYGILLHEIGHIFGNGHITSTIMESNIYQSMRGDILFANPRLTLIDHNRELSHCGLCSKSYTGFVADKWNEDKNNIVEDEQASQAEFKFLTGLAANGKITAQLALKNSTYISDATYTVSDNSGQIYSAPIQLTKQICPNDQDSRDVFKMALRWNNGQISLTSGDGRACVYKGLLKTASGQKVPVTLSLNMNTYYQGHLQLHYTSLIDGQEHALFMLPVLPLQ